MITNVRFDVGVIILWHSVNFHQAYRNSSFMMRIILKYENQGLLTLQTKANVKYTFEKEINFFHSFCCFGGKYCKTFLVSTQNLEFWVIPFQEEQTNRQANKLRKSRNDKMVSPTWSRPGFSKKTLISVDDIFSEIKKVFWNFIWKIWPQKGRKKISD